MKVLENSFPECVVSFDLGSNCDADSCVKVESSAQIGCLWGEGCDDVIHIFVNVS